MSYSINIKKMAASIVWLLVFTTAPVQLPAQINYVADLQASTVTTITDREDTLWADKLQVSEEVLRAHPDFLKFAKANFLHKHLQVHGHRIAVDSGSLMPSIPWESPGPNQLRYKAWSDIPREGTLDSRGELTSHYYTYRGYIRGQSENNLAVFKKLPSDAYDGNYVIEVVSADLNWFAKHVWIRLINPKGEMYSAGFWPKRKLEGVLDMAANLKPSEAVVKSPDLLEIARAPNKQTTTAFSITEEQFVAVLTYIQESQHNPRQYQLTGHGSKNCAKFVEDALRICDIEVVSSSFGGLICSDPSVISHWQSKVNTERQLELDMLMKILSAQPDAMPDDEIRGHRQRIQYGVPAVD